MQDLDAELEHRQHMVREIEKDLHTFDDIKKTKTWLKALKRDRPF